MTTFENDKDVKTLQRIFDIKKIALKPLSGKENFQGESEWIRFCNELQAGAYPDRKQLLETLLTILSPQQVGVLFNNDKPKITIQQVAGLAKGQKASVRLEYIKAIKNPDDQVALINEYLNEFNELHNSRRPFTGRQIIPQLKILFQRDSLEELEDLEQKLQIKSKPKLEELVLQVMKDLKNSLPQAKTEAENQHQPVPG